MHTCMPANSIFDGPITNLLSILWILVEVLSRAHAKRGNSHNDFNSGTSIGHFSSIGAVSTAVKESRRSWGKNPAWIRKAKCIHIFWSRGGGREQGVNTCRNGCNMAPRFLKQGTTNGNTANQEPPHSLQPQCFKL